MNFLNPVLRIWAYLFHLGLSTFLLGLAVLARKSHQQLTLDMLPFDSESMVSALTLLSLGGFIAVILAWMRIYPFVFPLWALAILLLMLYGFFFTSYQFAGVRGLERVGGLIGAALLALLGSLLVLMPRRRRRGKW